MAQNSRFATYIAPIMKTPKAQAYTMVIFSLFAIVFFGVFAIKPTILTIVALQKQISDANDANQKLATKIQELQQAQTSLDAVVPKEGLLTQALPDSPDISAVLLLLESRAASTQVGLGGVQFHAVALSGEEESAVAASQSATLSAQPQTSVPNSFATSPTINAIEFTFVVNGPLPKISDFLHQLVLPRRLLAVESITMTNKNGTTAATITAQVYNVVNTAGQ